MKRSYFLLLVAFLLFLGAGAIYAAQQFRLVWRNTIVAQTKSQLLFIKLVDAEFAARLRNSDGKEPAALLFVGDVMLSRGVAYQIKKNQDQTFPFLRVFDVLRSADLVFGNLEGPISDRGANQGSEYSFRADPKAVEGLALSGFDVMSLANNHIMDWGSDALTDTFDILKKNNIEPVGAGRDWNEANTPVVKNVRGTKTAFFAYTDLLPRGLEATTSAPGISSFDIGIAQNRVREIKRSGAADVVVVSLHWGEEYHAAPSELQRTIAHALVDAGVDLVVGHHPHVVQEIEQYKNGWIAYSLGNFVFDQDESGTREGAMIRAILVNRRIAAVSSEKVRISGFFQPEIVP